MWKQIIGHSQQVEQLERALTSRTLAQAYLFTGPRGVGKALVARTLTAVSLGVARENHPDAIWLRVLPDKSEISMEQWRAVEAKVQFQALEGERKFIIIDDAELMSGSVANACLKTLEEPPSNTHFILIAHDADRLLPTIRSRCQHMVFAPLPEMEISKWLATQGLEVRLASRAAQLSQGSFHRARILADATVLTTLDAVVSDVKAGITPQRILTHATQLAISEALPEILDGLVSSLRDTAVAAPTRKTLERIQTVEQASQFVAMKGANKELILNEMFISLSS